MGQNSAISWTDHTFNPWVGCLKVSPGCKNCYAETLMTRKGRWANTWGPSSTAERLRTSEAKWKEPLKWNSDTWKQCACGWRGSVRDLLPQPMSAYPLACPNCCQGYGLSDTHQRVFCASLADVFEDNDQLIDWRLDLFDLIRETPNLDWLILTKRPEVAKLFFSLRSDLLFDNIWLGVSAEDQEQADKRIPELLEIPVRIRFLSAEPLLGPIDLNKRELICADWRKGLTIGTYLDLVIAGGESGPNARPMALNWVRSLRDQCQATGVAFHFKQWGEFLPLVGHREFLDIPAGERPWCRVDGETMVRLGKHFAGRMLDGRTWDEFPQVATLIEIPVEVEREVKYQTALKLVARIDEDLTRGIRHYRNKAGALLTTLDEVVRAILAEELAQPETLEVTAI